ncbi:DNA-binding transcriptional regulator, MarR family [Paenibacillus sp. UNCCL117]|uniref:MarR family winged helix-turn-helix transcriptional regulator n=1 Tax=unclassified Paenibacillus TaxID=185978 RepID=UPI0008861EFF|nr:MULTISPECIES: MarR family transcriptional regulator [unclassified Paenibacillus]SDE46438.1 DNA-binding transcriptional regulator, MarR family [Paenibacillus sp. cl123]SFW65854.1 DNA-binding transcriptional regulator, MarR family [Paenibacillus sp. UNCCL117]
MDIRRSESIFHLMSHLMRLHRHHIHLHVQELDVYPGQPPLLFRLAERDGQSQRELAEQLRVKPATLTVMITRMQKNGLLERRPDADDQRVTRVYLTPKGEETTRRLKETLQTLEARNLESFLPEERLLLRRLLLQLYDNLAEYEPSADTFAPPNS